MTPKRVFIVTGANAGLGFKASSDLAKLDDAYVIMAGRILDCIEAAAKRVREATEGVGSVVEAEVVDLSSSESVSKFCTTIKSRAPAHSGLTILCNAGVQLPTKTLTQDGVEMTFGVNHLGHFQLVTTLLDITKRVVVVSSETHDPSEFVPNAEPKPVDVKTLAVGMTPYSGMETYAVSKLLNLLFMNELLRRYPTGIEAIAYSPGFTPDTRLGRHRDMTNFNLDAVKASLARCGVPVSTTEFSGGFMAEICAERDWGARGWTSGMYIRLDVPYHTSKQAGDPKLSKEVWELSEKLLQDVGAQS